MHPQTAKSLNRPPPAQELQKLMRLKERIEELLNGVGDRGRLLLLNALLAAELEKAGGRARYSQSGLLLGNAAEETACRDYERCR